MVVDAGTVGGWQCWALFLTLHAFMAQVPALCQELDGHHLEPSLYRYDLALTVFGSRAYKYDTLGPALCLILLLHY